MPTQEDEKLDMSQLRKGQAHRQVGLGTILQAMWCEPKKKKKFKKQEKQSSCWSLG